MRLDPMSSKNAALGPVADQGRHGSGVCPICAGADLEVVPVDYPFLSHLNYTTIKPRGLIGRCRTCQALYQASSERSVDASQALLGTEQYAQSQQTNQTFTVAEFPRPATRCFLQAELIANAVSKPNLTVLDIGAFDGLLLRELQSRLPAAELHAFDVNPHLRPFYPSEGGIRFWSPDLAAVEGGFDVICMSHSMMYEKNTTRLMARIKSLLRKDGFLFLQVPDITASPCYILMGDQCYYYTANILGNTLRQFGFSFAPVQVQWFPREVAGIARQSVAVPDEFVPDRQVYRCVEDLDSKAATLGELKERPRVGILGTTANAAFADSLLGERGFAFFDENPHRVGVPFRGKQVLHPRALTASDILVVPYGTSGERIGQRFRREYPCEIVVI